MSRQRNNFPIPPLDSLSFIYPPRCSEPDEAYITEDMRDKAYNICREFLSGTWKSISSRDMVFKSVRSVYAFSENTPVAAGPVWAALPRMAFVSAQPHFDCGESYCSRQPRRPVTRFSSRLRRACRPHAFAMHARRRTAVRSPSLPRLRVAFGDWHIWPDSFLTGCVRENL